jgi:predicted RNase H-like nuclease (RuvC/YqgF family)
MVNTKPNNSNINLPINDSNYTNESKIVTKNGVDANSIKKILNRISKNQQYENENPSVSNIIANSKTLQLTSLSPASFREQMARLRIENSNIRGDISRFKGTMEKLRNECDNMKTIMPSKNISSNSH